MSEVTSYKCPNCGGNLQFSSKAQTMKCMSCGSECDVDALKILYEEKQNPKRDNLNWENRPNRIWEESEKDNIVEYICDSCGGVIIGDKNLGATQCPFCDSPVIINGQFSGSLKPDIVIPFKLDKNNAKSKFKYYLSDKKLLAKTFKSDNHIEEIKGVYVPFWIYDASVAGQAKFTAQKSHFWTDGVYNYQTIEHYLVNRFGTMYYEAVPADGSSNMDDNLMQSIEPFDIREAKVFNAGYLSGYYADKYDIPSDTMLRVVSERIKTSMEESLRNTVMGYDMVEKVNSSIDIQKSQVRYALYPVWLLNTYYNDYLYTFAMNGQTGKFVGDLPVDKISAIKYFLLYFVGVFLLVYTILSLIS